MKKGYFDNVGFIYKFWYNVFIFLESISPFSVLRRFVFKNTKQFSDKWVLAHTLLSIATIFIVHYFDIKVLEISLIIYSSIRILEIIVYQINVLLFHPYKAMVKDKKEQYALQNPYRSVVLLGHNFIEIIFWFTAVSNYLADTKGPLLQTIMENAIRIFTFSYEKVAGQSGILQYVIFAEVLCGMILVIISLAKFIGELPHVDMKFEEEE